MREALPDLLRPGLRLVFCGKAGGAFWPTLAYVGLTPRELVPAEAELLPELGLGLTDVRKESHGFDVDGLHARIAAAEPQRLAFDGKSAARAALESEVAYGCQDEPFGGAEVWVLPSTAAAARGHWDIGPWEELAAVVLAEAGAP